MTVIRNAGLQISNDRFGFIIALRGYNNMASVAL